MANSDFTIEGNIVDVVNRKIYPGRIAVSKGKIIDIRHLQSVLNNFIVPGIVDAHVHIESTLLPPSEFSVAALKQGVLSAVTDPHEIANVCGIDGVRFMVNDSKRVPFYFKIGAPSCVPATSLESSGSVISSREIDVLFAENICSHLSEMMNFPGVIEGDSEIIQKIAVAQKYGFVVDGHAPFLSGEALRIYVASGISTDHECTTIEEAREKLNLGMKILIREGSAAKNLDTLKLLIPEFKDSIMLCSDDIHADNIVSGYLRSAVMRLISEGYNVFDVLQIASVNACKHYNIPLGLLQIGDNADFVVIDSFDKFIIQQVFVKGKEVSHFKTKPIRSVINNFNSTTIKEDDILVVAKKLKLKVIGIIDKEIVTRNLVLEINCINGYAEADVEKDILKIVVVNRYQKFSLAVGFVQGFGLKSGAVATSISHDSHNIICIGTNNSDIVSAINRVIITKGGICYVSNNEINNIDLPIAGLMSNAGIEFVAKKYVEIENTIKANGSLLTSPLMNLSFLSLLVIPKLKISDRGLFDFSTFSYTDIFI